MTTIDATNLAEMVLSLLERTAMVLAEPVAEGDECPEPTRFARIAYWGPSRGTLVLGADDGILREVAASLLGVEPGEIEIERDGNDALKEIANTVAGSVILALSGERCEYSLGLPELVSPADVPETADAACSVAAEGGALRVIWREEKAAAEGAVQRS
jgi:CheY-specific phosphatase CheX